MARLAGSSTTQAWSDYLLRPGGRLALLGALTATYLILVAAHIHYVNGSYHWHWRWRQPRLHAAYLWFLIPTALLAVVHLRLRRPALGAASRLHDLALIVLTSILFQLALPMAEQGGFSVIREHVESPRSGSYYVDATALQHNPGWLGKYAVTKRHLHASTHPPGPILYFMLMLDTFGPSHAALAGAMVLGILAASGCVAMYLFASLWTSDPRARLITATLHGFTPGLVAFLTSFDSFYASLTMILLLSWERALRTRLLWVVPFVLSGLLLTFMAYNVLVLGAFFVLSGIHFLYSSPSLYPAARRLVSIAGIAVLCSTLCYSLLGILTAYDPIATFKAARLALATMDPRPKGLALIFNVYDFILGAGLSIAILAAMHYRMLWRRRLATEYPHILISIGWLTILIVNCSRLLDWETARTWLFLQPFLTLPAGLEVSRWSNGERFAVMLLQALNVMVLTSNMQFIWS